MSRHQPSVTPQNTEKVQYALFSVSECNLADLLTLSMVIFERIDALQIRCLPLTMWYSEQAADCETWYLCPTFKSDGEHLYAIALVNLLNAAASTYPFNYRSTFTDFPVISFRLNQARWMKITSLILAEQWNLVVEYLLFCQLINRSKENATGIKKVTSISIHTTNTGKKVISSEMKNTTRKLFRIVDYQLPKMPYLNKWHFLSSSSHRCPLELALKRSSLLSGASVLVLPVPGNQS